MRASQVIDKLSVRPSIGKSPAQPLEPSSCHTGPVHGRWLRDAAQSQAWLTAHRTRPCIAHHISMMEQAEVRVAREKGRRRGALAAKQESELAAAQAEVAAVRAAAESTQRIANAAADDKKRLQVLMNSLLYSTHDTHALSALPPCAFSNTSIDQAYA